FSVCATLVATAAATKYGFKKSAPAVGFLPGVEKSRKSADILFGSYRILSKLFSKFAPCLRELPMPIHKQERFALVIEGVGAVGIRETLVHQNQVRPEKMILLEGFVCCRSLRDDSHVWLRGENQRQSFVKH